MAYKADRAVALLPPTTIAAAVTAALSTAVTDVVGVNVLTCQATFLYGSGGTNVKAWVQTTFDQGVTWVDIMTFAFTTTAAQKISSVRSSTVVTAAYVPTDATLADDTLKDGLIGSQIRIKYTSTGIYAGATSLAIHAVLHG